MRVTCEDFTCGKCAKRENTIYDDVWTCADGFGIILDDNYNCELASKGYDDALDVKHRMRKSRRLRGEIRKRRRRDDPTMV